MNCSEIVELSALTATYGPGVIRNTTALSESCLRGYWSASKCRMNRWGLSLARYQKSSEKLGKEWAHAQWHAIVPTMQEVLTSEMLTRAFSAVVCGHDRLHGHGEEEPIVQSIYMGHLEMRYRVLQLMVEGDMGQTDTGIQLNHLRRRCERWTDLLISYMLQTANVAEFAFDADRAADFAENLQRNRNDGVAQQSWNLTLASLREAFRHRLPRGTSNADLNNQIAGGVIGCFPPELFDSTGPLETLWVTRMESMADDAETMVSELLMLDEVSTHKLSGRLRS
ncbi:MAG: hypothetical protein KDA42_10005 [Planctomycetales bacterium]|nr:hypothetical protein [Planctomycetales bacterium]